jgi:hypothetical protein
MIAKTVEGSGFKGALNYNSKGILLNTNFASTDTNAMAKETKFTRQLRPNFKNAVWHTSLSLPPEEKLTQEQWVEIADKYLKAMGFNLLLNQYAVFLHTDTDNQHIHIVANKIGSDGSFVNSFQNYKKQDKFCRKIEEEYGLIAVPVPEIERRKIVITQGEIELNNRTGKLTPKLFIAQNIDFLLQSKPTLEQFISDLALVGIDVNLKKNDETGQLKGISFGFDGQNYTGTGLGRQFSFNNLIKKGLNYEQQSTSNKNTNGSSNTKQADTTTANTTSTDTAAPAKTSSKLHTETNRTTTNTSVAKTRKTAPAGFKSHKRNNDTTKQANEPSATTQQSFNSYIGSVSTDNSNNTVKSALNEAQKHSSDKKEQPPADPDPEPAVLQINAKELNKKLSYKTDMLQKLQQIMLVADKLAGKIIEVLHLHRTSLDKIK